MPARTTVLPLTVLAAMVGLAAAVAAARPRTEPPLARTVHPTPDESILERVAAKLDVTAALLRGELTLAEAAARFQELNGDDPRPMDVLRARYPAAGDEELICRQVLSFAANDHRATDAQRGTRMRALLAEFQARFPAAAPFHDWLRVGGGTGMPEPAPAG